MILYELKEEMERYLADNDTEALVFVVRAEEQHLPEEEDQEYVEVHTQQSGLELEVIPVPPTILPTVTLSLDSSFNPKTQPNSTYETGFLVCECVAGSVRALLELGEIVSEFFYEDQTDTTKVQIIPSSRIVIEDNLEDVGVVRLAFQRVIKKNIY